MNIISRRMIKRLLPITVSIASIIYSTANACNGAIDDKLFEEGAHKGFYYNFWKQTAEDNVRISCGDNGNFSASWRNVFNWIGGIGWNPGGPRVVSYSGTFKPAATQDSQNAYLMLYGRTTDPVIEYYVMESYGSYNPLNCGPRRHFGSFQSDGATYDLLECLIVPLGGESRILYFSIRNPPLPWGEVGGTITVANHFDEWAKHGMDLGTHDFMILAVESYNGNRNSAGSANLTVREGVFDPQLPRCGSQGGVPVCCSIHADPDRDGMGEEDGEVCTVTSETVGTHPDNPPDVLAAINVGGSGDAIQYNGIWYEPSTYVTGGLFDTARGEVFGGDGNAIFQSGFSGDLRLSIPISSQQVSVELSFVEFMFVSSGGRVFDVTIENQRFLENVDVFAEAGKNSVWRPSPFVVNVSDGILNINIDASVGKGILSSVLVRKSTSSTSSSSGAAGAIDIWFLLIAASGLSAMFGRFFCEKLTRNK